MSNIESAELGAGFDDYAKSANQVFRTCLEVMSRPGQIRRLDAPLEVRQPLFSTTAAVLLTLVDFETTYWTDLTTTSEADTHVDAFVRFHTGARRVADPSAADFAVITDVEAMPPLMAFMTGTPEYPDRSTTLLCQVEALQACGDRFVGPGIRDTVAFSTQPKVPDFHAQLAGNRASFPCGVDLVFTTETHIAALPRSVVRLEEA